MSIPNSNAMLFFNKIFDRSLAKVKTLIIFEKYIYFSVHFFHSHNLNLKIFYKHQHRTNDLDQHTVTSM